MPWWRSWCRCRVRSLSALEPGTTAWQQDRASDTYFRFYARYKFVTYWLISYTTTALPSYQLPSYQLRQYQHQQCTIPPPPCIITITHHSTCDCNACHQRRQLDYGIQNATPALIYRRRKPVGPDGKSVPLKKIKKSKILFWSKFHIKFWHLFIHLL